MAYISCVPKNWSFWQPGKREAVMRFFIKVNINFLLFMVKGHHAFWRPLN